MEALILSCSTGGGHNSAARAIGDMFTSRGHRATVMDPYQLAGEKVSALVSNAYIKLVQASPKMFGMVYHLGDMYRHLPIHSPVYKINEKMAPAMTRFLEDNHFDIIIMTHVYPALILTYLRTLGVKLPPTMFVATDYACIPFTEETTCDYFVIPSAEFYGEFAAYGIDTSKLLPYGIPVNAKFLSPMSKSAACSILGLDPQKRYILVSGGSMGAGGITKITATIGGYMTEHPSLNHHLIVICGNNKKLRTRLFESYADRSDVTIMGRTDKMEVFLRACDCFLTKPGGLSSTEAAASGTPLIHISPIPGCETRNVDYFVRHGMSIAPNGTGREITNALTKLGNPQIRREQLEAERRYIDGRSAERICDFAESLGR